MSINQVTRKKYKQSKKRNYGQPKTGTSVSKSSQMRKQEKEKRRQERIKNKKPIRRIFPIWLRIIVVLIFSVIALIAGLMIVYGIVCDVMITDSLILVILSKFLDIFTKN